MKILVSITSYKKEKVNYLSQVLKNYDDISNALNCKIDIILSTNYQYNFICKNQIDHTVSNIDREIYWEYCWENKNKIVSRFNDYDYIIESDDDVFISLDNILQYIKLENIDHKFIPGFLITERDKNKNIYIQSMISDSDPGYVLKENDSLYFTPKNVHSACYMIDKKRMMGFLSVNPNFSKIKSIKEYDVGCTSVSEPYFYFQKIISMNDWLRHMVNHLTNRYINAEYDLDIFPKDYYLKYKTIEYWKSKILSQNNTHII